MYKKENKHKKRNMFCPSANFIKIKRIMDFQSFILNLQGMHKIVHNTEKWVRIKILNISMDKFLLCNFANRKLMPDLYLHTS